MTACSSAAQAWAVSGAGRARVAGVAARRSRSSSTHSRTRSSRASTLTSPVTIGAIAASQAIASAASPSSQAPSFAPVSEACARCAAHRARTCAVHCSCSAELPSQPEQVRQRDVHPDLDRLPGPLRQQVRGGQPAHRLGQRVVVPLLLGPVVLLPGRGGQRVQHRRDRRGALRRSGPRASPRRRRSWWPASRSRSANSRRPGPASGQVAPGPHVHLREQRRQVLQPQPAGRRRPAAAHRTRSRYFSGSLSVHRQISRPTDSETCPAASAASTRGWVRGPPGPGGVPDGGAAGDPGPVHQPRHRAVVRVPGVALPGGERGQHRRPAPPSPSRRPAPARAGTRPGSRRRAGWRRRRPGSPARRGPCPAPHGHWQRPGQCPPGSPPHRDWSLLPAVLVPAGQVSRI